MKMKEMVRYGYFSPSGYEILENGCIKFIHFIRDRNPDYTKINIDNIIHAVKNNPEETGGEYDRTHYIESLNSWLKILNRDELCIKLIYNITTLTAFRTEHICNCGCTWIEKTFLSDSPETDKWRYGEIAKAKNFIREYVDDKKIHRIIKTQTCDICKLDLAIINLCKKIPTLRNEVKSRQTQAILFFQNNPKYNPVNYVITRRSSGYNPTAFKRMGTQIGSTNGHGGYNKYTCYIVRADSA